MKKLMFGLAIAAVGTAFAVESSNIVGYSQRDCSGRNWSCVSFGFDTVGGTGGYFTMSDISTENFDDGADTLQLLEPVQARTVKTYFCSGGDWYEDQDDWNEANDDTFDAGVGFLANLASGSVSLTCSGQVSTGPQMLNLAGLNWVMVGNPIPRAVKFKEIEATNFDDGADTLQVLEANQARTVKSYFCSGGDWYEDQDDWNDASEDTINAGDALLANVASGNVRLTFPSAY